MKPLKLTLQAFGPFAGKEVIDFSQLGEHALFLVNGSTGSGKTSILDALSTALYGDTTGGERSSEQMRCHFSKSDLITQLTLEFQLGEVHYRIQRQPKQVIKKSRGSGTVEKNSTAALHQLNQDHSTKLLASKVTEVNAKITELLGMSDKQFRQVMILPQGKFRDLLLAESKAREAIFQQLFQTQIYEQIQTAVADKAKQVRNLTSKAHEQIKWQLSEHQLSSETDLHQKITQQTQSVQQMAKRKATSHQALQTQQNQFNDAKHLLNRFKELAHYQAQQSHLQQQAKDIEKLSKQIEMARLASQLQPLLTQTQEAETRFQQQEQAVLNKRHELKSATKIQQQTEQALKRAEHNAQSIPAMEQKKTELAQLKPQLIQLNEFNQQILQKSQATEAAKQSLETTHQNILVSTEAIEQLNQALEATDQNRKQKPELIAQIHQLDAQVTRYRNYETTQHRLEQANNQVKQVEKTDQTQSQTCQKWSKQANQLEYHWHLGQAAELALQLQANQPCPVCGSPHHPAPADQTSETPIVTKIEVDQAREQLKQAEQKRNHTQQALMEAKNHQRHLTSELETLADKLKNDLKTPLAKLQAELENKQQQLSHLEQLEKNQEKEKSTLVQARQQLKKQQQQQIQAKETYDRHSAELEQATRQINELESKLAEKLPPECHTIEQLEQTLSSLVQDIQALRHQTETARKNHTAQTLKVGELQATVNTMTQASDILKTEWQSKQLDWQQALQASPFETEQTVIKAHLSDSQQNQIKQAIQQYDAQSAVIQGAIETLGAKLKDQMHPDIQALETQLNEANEQYLTLETDYNKAAHQLQNLQKAEKNVQSIYADIEQFEQEYQTIGTLSEVLSGQGEGKVNLQRFVQATLLDEVLSDANQRLYKMTQSQFELQRKTEVARHGRASGLDLEVYDHHTGRTRDVATLSGGESFMAALSLALGLSDVVQGYAGGIRLETLFIDEGFGSLDQDALEEVIDVFEQLQSNGRTIGIISHVSELKTQMRKRIDVIKQHHGSTLKLVF